MRRFVVAGLIGLFFALPAQAGLYSPEESFNFEIDGEGFARPIQYKGGFEVIVSTYGAVGNRPRTSEDTPHPARVEYQQRAAARLKKGVASLSQDELAGLTADLVRLGRADEALNTLQPIARDPRRGGFLAYAHLATAHASRGEWGEAFAQQQSAVLHSEFPSTFAKLTKPQLTWLKRVERDYYLPFLAHRAQEARARRPGDQRVREDVDALFPAAIPPKKVTDPVRFVGDDGSYVAGALAAAERKKLPPDAIAIVQQLLFWHPKDARLWWLLGELYNSEGDVETAARILDTCTFSMGYSNPVVIEHRRVLKSAVEAASSARAQEAAKAKQEQEAEETQRLEAERDYQKRFWWIVAMGVALGLLLVYYQFREVIRRVRRTSSTG